MFQDFSFAEIEIHVKHFLNNTTYVKQILLKSCVTSLSSKKIVNTLLSINLR